MHPASRVLIYILAALVIPGLPFFMLSILFLLAVLVFLYRRRHPFRLVWRTRWLLLVLALGYGYSLPGAPVLGFLQDWSPSDEGLLRGLEQVLRLLTLLFWLDLLVLRMPSARLLAGLHSILRPFTVLGVDAERAAVRLGLTLRAIEDMERGIGNLKRLLRGDEEPDLPARIHIEVRTLRYWDVLVPGAMLMGALGWWLCA